MQPIHGRDISAAEVELICGQFSATRFASLCNTITWALARPDSISAPSFTERVNSKDAGIDAELIDIPQDQDFQSPLLRSGWNVLQYKQRNIMAQGRDATFSTLKSEMKGALTELEANIGRYPNTYVLFTPIDLGHVNASRRRRHAPESTQANTEEAASGQKQELIDAIRYGLPSNLHTDVQIIGAAELAAFLNGLCCKK